jgi:DNA-binding NarL/FixJ family response regulator
VRIVLAEDSTLLREGLVMVLSRLGHEVVRQVADAPSLIRTVEEEAAAGEVDVVITDVRMPPTNTSDGLQAAHRIRERHPGMPVLVLSQYIAAAYARELFSEDSTGLGYLLKDRVGRIEDFARALETVAEGGTVIDPDVVKHLMGNAAADSRSSALESLTPRELEILELMAQGRANSEIERELYVSSATVAKHIGNIFDKLGLDPHAGNRRVRAVLAFLGR